MTSLWHHFRWSSVKKAVTQGCNASIKQRQFVLLIGFWVGDKERYVLVVFWRKLRFKRWSLNSKSQHVSSEPLYEMYWRRCDVTRWSHGLHFTPISYLAWGCNRSQMSLWLVKRISAGIIFPLRSGNCDATELKLSFSSVGESPFIYLINLRGQKWSQSPLALLRNSSMCIGLN